MQFIDLKTQYQKTATDINKRLAQVFEHGQFIRGPEVLELEQALAQYVGVKHCIGMANGTDALLVALMAAGVGSGDEVITTPFTFLAPAEMAKLLGAKVVLVDIDPRTYNLDANLLKQAISPKTKAIIPVSLYGQCADFDPINKLANEYNITVIEDAAQSFGATYKGKRSCGLSAMACTSFFPSKPLGCYGDGGACFTDDDTLAEALRCIANHGQGSRYHHVRLGVNSRLDTMQAAILLAKLKLFPEEIKQRERLAAKYSALLAEHIKVPYIESHNTSVFAQYTVACEQRDKVVAYLQEHGIPTAVHYPKALHQQIVFQDAKFTALPNAEQAAREVLSLPFSPYLREDELQQVAESLINALGQR